MTQGPDHNSYFHELFLRGLPKLCQKMKRPAKSPHGMAMPATGAHPDFYSMSLYAPLPDQGVLAPPAPAAPTSALFSGSDSSDQGGVVTNSSVSAYPGTSSDSDRNGISSDSDRNGSSRDGGGSDESDRNTSGASSDGRDESALGLSGSDRNSGYNEDLGSDRSSSDNERLSGSDGSSSPRSSGRKKFSRKRDLIDRADSSVRGSDSSERSSLRDLNFLTASLAANKQADVPMTIGGNLQDMSTSGGGLPAGMAAAFSDLGQSNYAGLPFTSPLTAANLSAVNQPSSANTSAANQGAFAHPTAPLTASNLSYLSLQNQLIQSQATIAKLLAYQQQMGLPPMPATAGDQLPSTAASTQPPTNQEKLQGKSK